jgi:hypothetical protein
VPECCNCGKMFFIGGQSIDGYRYCGTRCSQRHSVIVAAERVPAASVQQFVERWRHGPCPICKRQDGPIDVHAAHRVVSLLIVTQWATQRHVSCRRCGRNKQLLAIIQSAVWGWWGIPWGLVITPIQIVRNVVGATRRETATATMHFEQVVRRELAAQQLQSARRDVQAW